MKKLIWENHMKIDMKIGVMKIGFIKIGVMKIEMNIDNYENWVHIIWDYEYQCYKNWYEHWYENWCGYWYVNWIGFEN